MRYWLTPAPDEQFDEKVRDINSLYHQALELTKKGERVMGIDELPGVQALEQKHAGWPMVPGKVERPDARIAVRHRHTARWLMNELLEKLFGGDLRSEGRADEVARELIGNPSPLPELAEGLHNDNKLIRARTCMTMEIISREHPELLAEMVPQLMALAATDTVPQVRWHIAEILGNVPLSAEQIERIIPILIEYLNDKSKIVKYCTAQTLGVIGQAGPLKEDIADRIIDLKPVSKSLDKAVTQALRNLGID